MHLMFGITMTCAGGPGKAEKRTSAMGQSRPFDVRIALGWARLVTKPRPTGSETTTNTIGIVFVCRLNTSTARLVWARSTSGQARPIPWHSVRKAWHRRLPSASLCASYRRRASRMRRARARLVISARAALGSLHSRAGPGNARRNLVSSRHEQETSGRDSRQLEI